MSSGDRRTMGAPRTPDLAGAEAAMHRAAQYARRRAEKFAKGYPAEHIRETSSQFRGSETSRDLRQLTSSRAQSSQTKDGKMNVKVAEYKESLTQRGTRVCCPIWEKAQAWRVQDPRKGHEIYYSPRAGGVFRSVDIDDYGYFSSWRYDSKGMRVKLSRWVSDQNRLDELGCLTGDEIERIGKQERLNIDQRMERLLQCFATLPSQISRGLSVTLSVDGHDDYDNFQIVQAATECSDVVSSRSVTEELDWLVSAAIKGDWLEEYQLGPNTKHLRLTPAGVRRLEELKPKAVNTEQGFIAMWFDESVNEAYGKGIEPAIRDAGYRPLRIDKKQHNNKIDDEIIAEIRRSRFVVCDFTCKLVDCDGERTAIPRGGVYYEAGFAQGLGIPVIWTCREDHIEHVHLDTRQFNHIDWKTPEDLRERLRNRIAAVIGDGPLKDR